MIKSAGIDVGNSSVKVSIVSNVGGKIDILSHTHEKVRNRNIKNVITKVFHDCLDDAGVKKDDLQYVATTGDKENIEFRSGHFYSMTTHARGARFLNSDVKSVVDVGAFYIKVINIDEIGRVISHQMTGQCASGTGQFVENISRYLGVGVSDVGPLSMLSKSPERISSICAVLSETDVINMVSRGIKISDIMKGVHLTISERILKMLARVWAEYPSMLTGGMSKDVGLLKALNEVAKEKGINGEVCTHEDAIFAGSLGAAILGGMRYQKLESSEKKVAC